MRPSPTSAAESAGAATAGICSKSACVFLAFFVFRLSTPFVLAKGSFEPLGGFRFGFLVLPAICAALIGGTRRKSVRAVLGKYRAGYRTIYGPRWTCQVDSGDPHGARAQIAHAAGRSRMLGWFRVLMPTDDRFFELFVGHSRVLVAGAIALRAVLDGGDGMQKHAREVMAREQEADEITKEVLLAVRRTFITPFDRGDIQELIQYMDDAIDQMNKTVKAINLFEIRTFSDNMREMGTAIMEVAKLTAEAIPLLQAVGTNATLLGTFAEEVIRIEDHSDELHEVGLKALLREGAVTNVMEYIIGREILDHLEKVVDRFEDVAKKVNSIVVENV